MVSSFINHFCMHVCMSITYIYKYDLLNLLNVTHIYVFRAEYLVLDSQLVVSSVGELFCLLSTFPNSCCSLYWVETSWAFPHPLWHVYCYLCSAQVHVGEALWV